MGRHYLRDGMGMLLISLLAAQSIQGAALVTKSLKVHSGSADAASAASTSDATSTAVASTGNSTTSGDSIVAYINSVTDFCVFAPPQPNSTIAVTEAIEVAWCTQPGHGGRLIPDGALLGAHFVKTKDYVQITGQLQGTMLNIAAGDSGGELDNHGATGKGNPVGGSVHGYTQFTNFMSDGQFCIKACTGPNARSLCQHIYDTLGCDWNMPGDYSTGSYTNCAGDDTEYAGVYGSSTYTNGASATVPPAHTPGATSLCTTVASPTNGAAASSVVVSSSSVMSTVSPVLTSIAVPTVANVVATGGIASVASTTAATIESSQATSSSATTSDASFQYGPSLFKMITLSALFTAIGSVFFI